MSDQTTVHPNVEELLLILANQQCRAVLSYFQESAEDSATVAELASGIRTDGDRAAREVTVRLHHATLPQLDDSGIIEYDPRSTIVRYDGHAGLDTLIDAITEVSNEDV